MNRGPLMNFSLGEGIRARGYKTGRFIKGFTFVTSAMYPGGEASHVLGGLSPDASI